MTVLLLLLMILILPGAWYGIDYLVKKIMNEKYNIKITLISFVIAVPILLMMFIYVLLAVALMSDAEFKD